jgi:hypothetical protein
MKMEVEYKAIKSIISFINTWQISLFKLIKMFTLQDKLSMEIFLLMSELSLPVLKEYH